MSRGRCGGRRPAIEDIRDDARKLIDVDRPPLADREGKDVDRPIVEAGDSSRSTNGRRDAPQKYTDAGRYAKHRRCGSASSPRIDPPVRRQDQRASSRDPGTRPESLQAPAGQRPTARFARIGRCRSSSSAFSNHVQQRVKIVHRQVPQPREMADALLQQVHVWCAGEDHFDQVAWRSRSEGSPLFVTWACPCP